MVDRRNPVPLYIQVKNHIISEIEKGNIRIGDKLMSETKMQQFYGVTRPTIRAALAGLVAEGCLRKEHGLGTFCVAYPQKERFVNVDVITNQSDSYFYPYVLKGVSQVFEKNKCNLLLHDSSGSLPRIISFMKQILARGTDGIIIPGVNKTHSEWDEFRRLLQQYRQAKIPVVSVMCAEPVEYCTSFSIDQSYGTELAAQHLIDCGHRRLLGLFQHRKKTISKYQRLSGFRRAVERCPDAIGYEIVEGDDFTDEVLRLIREEHITAIQCYNDFVAVECLRLLVANGYRVPEDISLIGFDDTEIARTSIPRLTTVTHPKDYMGAEAADAILRMINNPNEQVENMTYRPGLVIRQSVRKL